LLSTGGPLPISATNTAGSAALPRRAAMNSASSSAAPVVIGGEQIVAHVGDLSFAVEPHDIEHLPAQKQDHERARDELQHEDRRHQPQHRRRETAPYGSAPDLRARADIERGQSAASR
jgi:hypothetical protein